MIGPQECAEKCSAYGSVYAIAQTAVSMAYGFGPLFGGKLSETYGFPQVMRTVGIINFIYMPLMYYLRNENEEISRENDDELSRDESVSTYTMKFKKSLKICNFSYNLLISIAD